MTPSKTRPHPETKSTSSEPDPFDRLPKFDSSVFDPPEWAHNPSFPRPTDEHEKNGESSKSARVNGFSNGRYDNLSAQDIVDEAFRSSGGLRPDVVDDDDDDDRGEDDEVWEDAMEDLGVDPETGRFTLAELKRLLEKAQGLKVAGNTDFTARPARHDSAVQAYRDAINCLPVIQESLNKDNPGIGVGEPKLEEAIWPVTSDSGVQELTDEEASVFEAQLRQKAVGGDVNETLVARKMTEAEERARVEDEITELRKACWGNLGACYLAMGGKEKECAEACTEALKIDPHYVKALQRRATANSRISTWTSLTSAQTDYTLLITLLPASHPSVPSMRQTLATLPGKIQAQQEKEKDEMMGKLKELGNSILGKFGMSTDNFKFDPQEGGGYSMRFER